MVTMSSDNERIKMNAWFIAGICLAGITLFLLFIWSLCIVAGRADEAMERMRDD
jgi:hypothetical protein